MSSGDISLAERTAQSLAAINKIVATLPEGWKMIDLKDSAEYRERYLERFYNECMISNFPDKDELDPLDVWIEMFTPEYTTTVLHILVIITDTDQFAAGVVTEYYPESVCGLLSYLLVQPDFRGAPLHLVGKITEASVHSVDLTAQKNGVPQTIYYFLETNSPLGVLEINDNMPPRKRCVLFNRLGFRLSNWPYVQYPLADDQNSASYLLLCLYNRDADNPLTSIESSRILTWLKEFAISTGVAAGGADFDASVKWLENNPTIRVTSLLDYLAENDQAITQYNQPSSS